MQGDYSSLTAITWQKLKGKLLFRLTLAALILLSLWQSVHFANKTYRSYQVLDHARSLDIPDAGNIRAWMTFDYLSATYKVPLHDLVGALELPKDLDTSQTVGAYAEVKDLEKLDFIHDIQANLAAIGAAAPSIEAQEETEPPSWLDKISDQFFEALQLYGYPVLIVVLFLGALGLPLPAGPLTVIAGTLAQQGEFQAAIAIGLALMGSVLGDMVGYLAGRVLSPQFLDKWGRFVGYTLKNKERLNRLYLHWGGITLVLTRSLVAYIGIIASIVAGTSRYALPLYITYTIVGRSLWTLAYFGLGYFVGGNITVASGFLGYCSLTLLYLALAASLSYTLKRALSAC